MVRFLTAGICGVILLTGCDKQTDPLPSKDSETGAKVEALSDGELFEKITEGSGVRFVRNAGTNYAMPDQIGSGIVLFDFNQDEVLDLYCLQSGTSKKGNELFQGVGAGKFKNVSSGSGLDIVGEGMGAISGDLNNDGLPDLVVTQNGATKVFSNLGKGKFEERGVACGVDNPRWAVPASFIDFDRDGWLDLVVGNYVDYDPTRICHDQQGRQEFCAPSSFAPTPTRLWRNITEVPGAPPQFEDWSVRSGIVKIPGMALGLVCADFTGDNWPDIFCSDDGRPNRLFVNQRNGTFKEEAALRGLGYDAMGRTAANMGVAFADFSGDGLADLFITHLAEEFHSYFKQEQPGYYFDVVAQSGLQQQAWRGTGFGTVAADFDLDGWQDLAFVNGMIRRGGSAPHKPVGNGVDPWWGQYVQRHQIFLNKNGKFVDVSPDNKVFCGEATVGRSLAMGDLDNDGKIDLVVGNVAGPTELYRNVANKVGHWLKVRLIDPERGARDAIGAELRFVAGRRNLRQTLQPATSYLASHEAILHFGLGTAQSVEQAQVVWATGEVENFSIEGVNKSVVLKKGASKPGTQQ